MGPKLEPGQTARHERHCDRYRPIYYAGASGDYNPIHIDPEVGERAGLGGAILQGLCTMAWAAEAALKLAGDPAQLKRVKVRFAKPVRSGDTVGFEAKVESVEGGVAKVSITGKNQEGDEVLKLATSELSLGAGHAR